MVHRAGLYLGLAALCLVSSAVGGAAASFVILGAVLPSTSEEPEPPRSASPSADPGAPPGGAEPGRPVGPGGGQKPSP